MKANTKATCVTLKVLWWWYVAAEREKGEREMVRPRGRREKRAQFLGDNFVSCVVIDPFVS